jgi:hypothetical protein
MSSIPNFFSINGVIDTSKSVLENMNAICEASGCWLTFDIHEGKWAVVINNVGDSVASFDDSNIIGGIDITSTSLTEVYNSVTYEFPHQDLRSERDSVTMTIPNNDRYPNEPDNVLTISSELVNNQAQAQALAARQLKQSRVDKVITFTADYSYVNLKAGDLIDVSAKSYFDYDFFYPANYFENIEAAGYYGLINKKFRIINITEQDGDDGTLTMKITALEYSADVYSLSGLQITERNRQTGISAKSLNTSLTNNDNQSSLKLQLNDTAKALGLTLAFNAATGLYELGQAGAQAKIAGSSAVITWSYDDGSDLDIRCRIYSPNLGQNSVDDYLGWTGGTCPANPADVFAYESTYVWPASATDYIIKWSGDNTGAGGNLDSSESVFVNIDKFKTKYTGVKNLILECRGNWYGERGAKPVTLVCYIYEGGTMTQTDFKFIVNGYTKARYIEGVKTNVDSLSQDPSVLGDLMGYFVIDTEANIAQFRNDLTGIV